LIQSSSLLNPQSLEIPSYAIQTENKSNNLQIRKLMSQPPQCPLPKRPRILNQYIIHIPKYQPPLLIETATHSPQNTRRPLNVLRPFSLFIAFYGVHNLFAALN
jgi:hypothetical protein